MTPAAEEEVKLPMTPRFLCHTGSAKDRAQEFAGVAQHREAYAGQWVALDGERLIAHHPELKIVRQATAEAGRANDTILLFKAAMHFRIWVLKALPNMPHQLTCAAKLLHERLGKSLALKSKRGRHNQCVRCMVSRHFMDTNYDGNAGVGISEFCLLRGGKGIAAQFVRMGWLAAIGAAGSD